MQEVYTWINANPEINGLLWGVVCFSLAYAIAHIISYDWNREGSND